MKNQLILLGLLLSMVFAANGETLSETDREVLERLKQEAQQSSLSYTLLESLTTEVGARLAGTAGDKRAIAWATEKMRALGFDKVWTEEVSLPKWERGELSLEIVSPYPHNLFGISLGGSVGTKRSGITADVVEFSDLAALEAAPVGSLKGKIAFVSYRMERHIDGSGYSHGVGARSKGASVAAEKGAVAFILRSIGTDNNRTPHTGGMNYADGIKKIPAAAISNPDADLLVNMLKRKQPVQIKFKSSAKRSDKKMVKTANVIGEISGSVAPEELVVIGAHLDSWDVGTGAMDDGLGVAIVMASAAMIGKQAIKPKRTIRVILYAAEEVGFHGTRQYMLDHADEVEQHMIGAEWDFGIGEIYELRTGVGEQSLVAIADLANHLQSLGVALSNKNDAKAQSDMSLLSNAGMPSINFAPDGTNYFDLHHTENDTLDKIDAEDMKQNTAVYTVFTWFAAQSGVDYRR